MILTANMTENLTWNEIKSKNPKEFLTVVDYKIYQNALSDFTEMLKNSKPKQIKEFAENGLGIWAFRFARQFADAVKNPNLYKSIYAIVSEHKYDFVVVEKLRFK